MIVGAAERLDLSLAIGDRGLVSFALAFAITQLVEVPIYAARLGGFRGERTLARACWIGFGASALTHPIVWFLMPVVTVHVYAEAVAIWGPAAELRALGRVLLYGALAEGFAVFAEGFYLRALKVKRPFFLSLVANAASVAIGSLWALVAPQ